MSVSFELDHLVIAVTDLPQAVTDYRELGFNVVAGGRHQHAPTQNALIYFADGTYLELIEWTAPVPGEKWYERLTQQGEGLVDFAFVPSQIADAITQAAARGVTYRGPIDGSRIKPTGEHVRWQLGWPVSYALPFLCGDVTPRSLRVPEGDVRQHPNQASGIASIAIAVEHLQEAVHTWRAFLGPDSDAEWGEPQALSAAGLEGVSVQLGTVHVHLVAALAGDDSSPANAFRTAVKAKGQGVYRLCVTGVGQVPSRKDIVQLSHGVSLLLSDKPLSLLEQIA